MTIENSVWYFKPYISHCSELQRCNYGFVCPAIYQSEARSAELAYLGVGHARARSNAYTAHLLACATAKFICLQCVKTETANAHNTSSQTSEIMSINAAHITALGQHGRRSVAELQTVKDTIKRKSLKTAPISYRIISSALVFQAQLLKIITSS